MLETKPLKLLSYHGTRNNYRKSKGEFLKAVEKLLVEQSFALDEEARARMLEQIGKNYRYISVLGVHDEGGAKVMRFLKIPIWKPEEIDELFVRQVQVGKLLRSKGIDTPGIVTEKRIKPFIKREFERVFGNYEAAAEKDWVLSIGVRRSF